MAFALKKKTPLRTIRSPRRRGAGGGTSPRQEPPHCGGCAPTRLAAIRRRTRWMRTAPQTANHPEPSRAPGGLVRVAGFEPTASWSRTKRATNCATPGCSLIIIQNFCPNVKYFLVAGFEPTARPMPAFCRIRAQTAKGTFCPPAAAPLCSTARGGSAGSRPLHTFAGGRFPTFFAFFCDFPLNLGAVSYILKTATLYRRSEPWANL